MRTLAAILTLAFSAVSFMHFLGRIVRNRHKGRGRAAAVSAALSLMVLGPVVAIGLTRGLIRPAWYSYVEVAALVIALGLVVAILLVEQWEEQKDAVERSRAEAKRVISEGLNRRRP